MTIPQPLIDFYNRHIVKGWYKTWTVWLAAAAAILPAVPDLVQLLLDNWDTAVTAVPVFSDSTKATIRLVLLVLIPVVRAIKQKNVPPAIDPEATSAALNALWAESAARAAVLATAAPENRKEATDGH